MEDLSNTTSDSSSSILSLDKSDTNQSADQQNYKAEQAYQNSSMEKEESVNNFSLISKLKNTYTDKMSKTDAEFGKNVVDDEDDDLKELNSDILSEQMSKVVTQLEEHVLDQQPEEVYPNKTINNSQKHIENSNLMDTEVDMDEDDLVGKPDSDIDDQSVTSERSMQNCNEIQIKVIDVPDDDDLFDFLKDHSQLDQQDESSNISADLEKKVLSGNTSSYMYF